GWVADKVKQLDAYTTPAPDAGAAAQALHGAAHWTGKFGESLSEGFTGLGMMIGKGMQLGDAQTRSHAAKMIGAIAAHPIVAGEAVGKLIGDSVAEAGKDPLAATAAVAAFATPFVLGKVATALKVAVKAGQAAEKAAAVA